MTTPTRPKSDLTLARDGGTPARTRPEAPMLTAFVAACSGTGPAGPTLDDDRRAVATGIAARASAVAEQPLAVGTDWPWP